MTRKTFDCVRMKDAIQRRMLTQQQEKGVSVFWQESREWLDASPDSLAAWWRNAKACAPARQHQTGAAPALHVAESVPEYQVTASRHPKKEKPKRLTPPEPHN
ncbi:MAG: hypothetical protein A3K19_10310 [Lentisphaerae bacterium RIFOXYB12_FULL_65_16]|nr:MAG: hypothetical protein A3K18_32170 [Lentisphaerae bacterium RIFOXYA12_64_32]OGV91609.1 MAG: hypothetical protein A3K19_10310 [Lentisphaerae bacterium RIFOXYB12_FULL_65_16]